MSPEELRRLQENFQQASNAMKEDLAYSIINWDALGELLETSNEEHFRDLLESAREVLAILGRPLN
jgi:hypothetical protein